MITATTTRRQEGISLAELNATLKQKAITLRDGRYVTLTVNLKSGRIGVDLWDADSDADAVELLDRKAPGRRPALKAA